MSYENEVKLSLFSCTESDEKSIIFHFEPMSLGNFNLLIGDNAQGKTRFFSILMFIRDLINQNNMALNNSLRQMKTALKSAFEFKITNSDNSIDTVVYKLNIKPSLVGPSFIEEITKNNQVIFSTEKKKALNEKTNTSIEPIYLPPSVLAIAALTDEMFITVNCLRDYFQRALFLTASNTSREMIMASPEVTIPEPDGRNICSVLSNWSGQYPHLFKTVVSEWKKCFRFVEDVEVVEKKLGGIPTKLLSMHEKNVSQEILQHQWSGGMLRALNLLAFPNTPIKRANGEIVPPRLICIDEVENGLDYKTLDFIIKYLEEYSDDVQILISSHSPLVCDFIPPKEWRIIKRMGLRVKGISPADVEVGLEEELKKFNFTHWEFYKKHISNSGLYK